MRLEKSANNVLVSGVLAGIGEYYNVDPTFIRVAFVLLSFVGAFPMIPLYIIAALIMPRADRNNNEARKEEGIDKSADNQHNVDSLSETNEIKEEDWSDF
ncbi:MAG: PspC domain-containing protein [Atopostipes sp.]|nr:PspC domain-containing protein [Atopostipes sp.]